MKKIYLSVFTVLFTSFSHSNIYAAAKNAAFQDGPKQNIAGGKGAVSSLKTVSRDSTPSLASAEFKLKAFKEQHAIQLKWQQEKKDASFSIERSCDNATWREIGSVSNTGIDPLSLASVSFVDNQPREGLMFYRIRKVANTGATSYSTVKVVRIDNDILAEEPVVPEAGSLANNK